MAPSKKNIMEYQYIFYEKLFDLSKRKKVFFTLKTNGDFRRLNWNMRLNLDGLSEGS